MIRHVVLFKVKPSVSSDAIENAFFQLNQLKKLLPGIVNITCGECRFYEGKGKGYISHGFSIDFENENAYALFLTDKKSSPAKGCIINIAHNGFNGLYGFDIGKEYNVFPNPLDKYRIPTPRLMPPGSIR